MDSALSAREGWEAVYPILFCYRHTTELYLKAILTDAPFRHGLDELASELQKKILGKYRQDHVDRLLGRIRELHRIDPSSTVFRSRTWNCGSTFRTCSGRSAMSSMHWT